MTIPLDQRPCLQPGNYVITYVITDSNSHKAFQFKKSFEAYHKKEREEGPGDTWVERTDGRDG